MKTIMKTFYLLLFIATTGFAQGNDNLPLKVYSADGISVKSYNFEGIRHYFEKSDDTTYIVNFWATWCTPCIKELPYFEKIGAEYKNRNVKVVLISLDMPKQAESRLIPFIRKKALQSEVILLDDPDANAWIEKVSPQWSGAITATVIYNSKTRKFYEQTFTYEQLETELNQFIK